jgi:hypothetical protein
MPRTAYRILPLLLCWPTIARADSDGYFCAGRGFLAWETRLESRPVAHVLHVVRFPDAGGIAAEQQIALEDFQVHGLLCRDSTVEVAGWSTRHVVDLPDRAHPRVSVVAAPFDPQRSPQLNLGNWSQPGITDLESDAPTGTFQLVITRVSRSVPGGIEQYTTTQLLCREPAPGLRVLAAQTLFMGIFVETIDGDHGVRVVDGPSSPMHAGAGDR